jgi:hypothetical protein
MMNSDFQQSHKQVLITLSLKAGVQLISQGILNSIENTVGMVHRH